MATSAPGQLRNAVEHGPSGQAARNQTRKLALNEGCAPRIIAISCAQPWARATAPSIDFCSISADRTPAAKASPQPVESTIWRSGTGYSLRAQFPTLSSTETLVGLSPRCTASTGNHSNRRFQSRRRPHHARGKTLPDEPVNAPRAEPGPVGPISDQPTLRPRFTP
jgi:hypothetical protein